MPHVAGLCAFGLVVLLVLLQQGGKVQKANIYDVMN